MVGPPGFEPGISAMSRRRHNQLDHGPCFAYAPHDDCPCIPYYLSSPKGVLSISVKVTGLRTVLLLVHLEAH